MSTPFSEISKLMFDEMDQSKILNMNTDIASDLLSDLIITSATVDFVNCEKDLEKNIPYQEEVYEFKINNDKNNLEIDINKLDEKLKNNVVLYVNEEEVLNFKFNIDKDICNIQYSFRKDDAVEILFVFEGEFEADLTHREKYIIALGAYYHYMNQFVQQENVLKQEIGDKDYKRSSNWQTLKSLIGLKKNVAYNLNKYIDKYTYDKVEVDDLK